MAGGWNVGVLVIDQAAWLDVGEKLILIGDNALVEVKNGNQWQQIKIKDFKRKTIDGWPVLAGMTARVHPANNDAIENEQGEFAQAGQVMTKINEKVYQVVNDVMTIPSALRDIEANFWRQGYDVRRGVAGTVIIRLSDGEVHFVPVGMCIKQILFLFEKD
jgi:hypothetical protein